VIIAAIRYGERLNGRSGILQSQDALHNLVYEYSTQNFVIARSGTREVVFNPDQVRCPDNHENALGLVLAQLNPGVRGGIEIRHLNTEMLAIAPEAAAVPPAKAKAVRPRVAGKAKTR